MWWLRINIFLRINIKELIVFVKSDMRDYDHNFSLIVTITINCSHIINIRQQKSLKKISQLWHLHIQWYLYENTLKIFWAKYEERYSSTELGDKLNELHRKLKIIKTLGLVGEFVINIQILRTFGYQFCKYIVYTQGFTILLYTTKY